MARKHNLFAPKDPPPKADVVDEPRRRSGVIGAIGKSLADWQKKALIDVEPDLIDPSPFPDRLGADPDEEEAFIESLKRDGQQVPVLLRPHPEHEGRYQAAYGHRRIEALRHLGKPVKAAVRELTDVELVLAQGQENSQRRDLSFVERALFARRLEELGFERPVICAALATSKSHVSEMINLAHSIPRRLIEAIGSAPAVGRPRWAALAEKLTIEGAGQEAERALQQERFAALSTNERFEFVLNAVTPKKAPRTVPEKRELSAAGRTIGRLEVGQRAAKLTIDTAAAGEGFGTWLADRIDELHADFVRTKGAGDETGRR